MELSFSLLTNVFFLSGDVYKEWRLMAVTMVQLGFLLEGERMGVQYLWYVMLKAQGSGAKSWWCLEEYDPGAKQC